MPIDTQISSFAIPSQIWFSGYAGAPDVPALNLAVRDALAIERRAAKNVNLRNERRRYTLCCERMQGIVEIMANIPNALPPALVWNGRRDDQLPTSRAYLALMDAIPAWMDRFLNQEQIFQAGYLRFAAIFFPPEHAPYHLHAFEFIAKHPDIQSLFQGAAKRASVEGSLFMLTAEECRKAFYMRLEYLKHIATSGHGLIDVIGVI